MKINKITTGFVIQVFDTKKKQFVSQTFIAGDDVSIETEAGESVEGDDFETVDNATLPFDMVQPSVDDDSKAKIKCIVAGTNANGESDLFFCKVNCTPNQWNNDAHLNTAKNLAIQEGYELPLIAFDEFDDAGRAMLSLFIWETATVVEVK
jgi:hypothetical protein